MELITPERFRTEGVVTKDFLPLVKQLLHVGVGLVTKRAPLLGSRGWICLPGIGQTRTGGGEKTATQQTREGKSGHSTSYLRVLNPIAMPLAGSIVGFRVVY